jgi:hypothetical protein
VVREIADVESFIETLGRIKGNTVEDLSGRETKIK